MIRTFQEYDALAMRTAHHPTGSERALLYMGCALAGEAGEVANEINKEEIAATMEELYPYWKGQ